MDTDFVVRADNDPGSWGWPSRLTMLIAGRYVIQGKMGIYALFREGEQARFAAGFLMMPLNTGISHFLSSLWFLKDYDSFNQ